jgi:hypothetical protein
MKIFESRAGLAVAAVLAVAVAGCGDNKTVRKATFHGTVSYNGDPLSGGFIRFVGPAGDFSVAQIQKDGTYVVTDVVPGEQKVAVSQAPQSVGSSADALPKGKATPKKAPSTLPQKFYDTEASGVRVTVTADTQELPIDLK